MRRLGPESQRRLGDSQPAASWAGVLNSRLSCSHVSHWLPTMMTYCT